MRGDCVANYAGSFNGRILEEIGYRNKEDLLNAKVFDLLLIGSFSRYDVLRIITELAREERPSAIKRLDKPVLGSMKGVTIYGQSKNDYPSDKVKAITMRDVLHFQTLSLEKVTVLFLILENAIWTRKPDPRKGVFQNKGVDAIAGRS